MRVLAIVHEPDAGPGVFAESAQTRGAVVEKWDITAEARPPDAPERYDAVLALGGSMHPHELAAHPWMADEVQLLAALVAAGRPVLGVCLGSQLLTRASGGTTELMAEPEIGWYTVAVGRSGRRDPVLGPLGASFCALQWHSCASRLSGGATTLAASERCVQAFRVGRRAWGIQFHAEVTRTDFESWIDHLGHDGSGDRPPDPAAFRRVTHERMEAWNALGRGLFDRFLDAAAAGATA